MKQKMTLFVAALFVASCTTILLAQKGAPQQQIPLGGFKDSVAGTWNCGEFGTLTLKQTGNKVTGSYNVSGGTVNGVITGQKFIGQWSESETGESGSFEFETSIRRMTDRPTHLTGRWKNSGDKNWQTGWNCSN